MEGTGTLFRRRTTSDQRFNNRRSLVRHDDTVGADLSSLTLQDLVIRVIYACEPFPTRAVQRWRGLGKYLATVLVFWVAPHPRPPQGLLSAQDEGSGLIALCCTW